MSQESILLSGPLRQRPHLTSLIPKQPLPMRSICFAILELGGSPGLSTAPMLPKSSRSAPSDSFSLPEHQGFIAQRGTIPRAVLRSREHIWDNQLG